MQLPGGMEVAADIARDFAFRPVTGEVELAMAEAARDRSELVATRVTCALSAALDSVAGQSAEPALVDALCVGDRQYLMQQLAAHVGVDAGWLVARCGGCATDFDFHLEQGSLPVKPAGLGYPYADVDTSQGSCRFRVPTGADQRAVAAPASNDPEEQLLRRCLVETEGGPPPAGKLGFSCLDRQRIDQALEEVAPQVTSQALAACPACGKDNVVALNPYLLLDCIADTIVQEIHTLAWHYHWSEASILALPRRRRQHYIDLIEQTLRPPTAGGSATGIPAWAS